MSNLSKSLRLSTPLPPNPPSASTNPAPQLTSLVFSLCRSDCGAFPRYENSGHAPCHSRVDHTNGLTLTLCVLPYFQMQSRQEWVAPRYALSVHRDVYGAHFVEYMPHAFVVSALQLADLPLERQRNKTKSICRLTVPILLSSPSSQTLPLHQSFCVGRYCTESCEWKRNNRQ